MLEILCAFSKNGNTGISIVWVRFPFSFFHFHLARQGVHVSLSHGRRQMDGKEEGKPKSHKNLGTGALFHGGSRLATAAIGADPGRAVPQVPLCQMGSGGIFLRSESRVFSN